MCSQGESSDNTSVKEPQDGYDLIVYGLDSGQFVDIHAVALSFIALSFVCVVSVIIASFVLNRTKNFWTWTKSERFVVYLAICDGLYNIAHSMDHAHYLATECHVKPKSLCAFYGFMLAEFILSQNLMVNIVAINAFLLIYFGKDLNFSRFDHRLLLYTYGLPFVGACFAAGFDQFGPNGAFCYFDGVKGKIANILFTTVPLLLILIANTVMYILTWYRIYSQGRRLRRRLQQNAQITSAATKAAKTMSLFVVAFFIQWWSLATYGVWQWFDNEPHEFIFRCVTTFTNIGGVLNMFVFLIMRKRMIKESLRERTTQRSLKNDSSNVKTTEFTSSDSTINKNKI